MITFDHKHKDTYFTNQMYETIQIKTHTDLFDVMPTESHVLKDGDQLMLKGYVAYVKIP